MRIKLNGAWRELDGAALLSAAGELVADAPAAAVAGSGANLAAVLAQLGYGQSPVATALNGEFVPVRARERASVRDGDRIEVLAPMQGG
jgi:sulfur carrier protein